MKTIYVAFSSFYDSECKFELCAGSNKKKTVRRAVQLLKEDHEADPYPDFYFGDHPRKIDSRYVDLKKVELVD